MMSKRRVLRISQVCLALVTLLIAIEADARGRGGGSRRSGGFNGASHSRTSRSGPAQWGSVRHSQPSGRGYDSRNRYPSDRRAQDTYGRNSRRDPYGQPTSRDSYGQRGELERNKTVDGDTTSREATYTNSKGETSHYSGSTTRTDDGVSRSGSFQTSKGASGSGSAEVQTKDGRVDSVERSRDLQTASGETASRKVSSERDGNWIVRDGEIKTSTGIDANTAGEFKKTDDGFVARGAIEGKNGAAAGTIIRDGNDTYARGGATDGHYATWGRVHCKNGKCYGGRVYVDVKHYHNHYNPYWYYPYHYAYYACPPAGTVYYSGYYGTPVYSCSHTVIVYTSFTVKASNSDAQLEVQATSSPVVMYELSDGLVVYSTSYEPNGVYAEQLSGRYFWPPGLADRSSEAKEWIARAAGTEIPTANATVITYTIGDHFVYLTNEPPVPGIYAEQADLLFVWIPGVREPSEDERNAIATAISAHNGGGASALEAEVRKLQVERSPPPSAAEAGSAETADS